MADHDVVIRAGTVIDGTGAPARTADVAITAGRITEVGAVEGRGRREVAAEGLLVTPGFVDIHSHYDGQATWDSRLAAVGVARRHHRRDGQLRRRASRPCARPTATGSSS